MQFLARVVDAVDGAQERLLGALRALTPVVVRLPVDPDLPARAADRCFEGQALRDRLADDLDELGDELLGALRRASHGVSRSPPATPAEAGDAVRVVGGLRGALSGFAVRGGAVACTQTVEVALVHLVAPACGAGGLRASDAGPSARAPHGDAALHRALGEPGTRDEVRNGEPRIGRAVGRGLHRVWGRERASARALDTRRSVGEQL
jgi:hypothetical protein